MNQSSTSITTPLFDPPPSLPPSSNHSHNSTPPNTRTNTSSLSLLSSSATHAQQRHHPKQPEDAADAAGASPYSLADNRPTLFRTPDYDKYNEVFAYQTSDFPYCITLPMIVINQISSRVLLCFYILVAIFGIIYVGTWTWYESHRGKTFQFAILAMNIVFFTIPIFCVMFLKSVFRSKHVQYLFEQSCGGIVPLRFTVIAYLNFIATLLSQIFLSLTSPNVLFFTFQMLLWLLLSIPIMTTITICVYIFDMHTTLTKEFASQLLKRRIPTQDRVESIENGEINTENDVLWLRNRYFLLSDLCQTTSQRFGYYFLAVLGFLIWCTICSIILIYVSKVYILFAVISIYFLAITEFGGLLVMCNEKGLFLRNRITYHLINQNIVPSIETSTLFRYFEFGKIEIYFFEGFSLHSSVLITILGLIAGSLVPSIL